MYAVIETGGKQYKVAEGDLIEVEKLEVDKDAQVILDKVLMIENDGEYSLGKPYLEGKTVETVKVDDSKGPKRLIYKYRRRKDSEVKRGHRQKYTLLEVKKINL